MGEEAPEVYYYIPSILGHLYARMMLVALSKGIGLTVPEMSYICKIPVATVNRLTNELLKLGLIRVAKEVRLHKYGKPAQQYTINVSELSVLFERGKLYVAMGARKDAPDEIKRIATHNPVEINPRGLKFISTDQDLGRDRPTAKFSIQGIPLVGACKILPLIY